MALKKVKSKKKKKGPQINMAPTLNIFGFVSRFLYSGVWQVCMFSFTRGRAMGNETIILLAQRNKNKFMSSLFPFRHPNLELVKGDACDVESFTAALKGKDAVISCLGVFASIFNPTTFYSESMFAILDGMKRYTQHKEKSNVHTAKAFCNISEVTLRGFPVCTAQSQNSDVY